MLASTEECNKQCQHPFHHGHFCVDVKTRRTGHNRLAKLKPVPQAETKHKDATQQKWLQ